MSDKGYDAYAHERGMSYHSRPERGGDRDSDSASLTDSDSDLEAGRSRRARRPRGNSRAIVKREPYHVAPPPRAYHPADSDESFEQVYGDRERRRLPEQRGSSSDNAGLLVAVALAAAACVLCITECCD